MKIIRLTQSYSNQLQPLDGVQNSDAMEGLIPNTKKKCSVKGCNNEVKYDPSNPSNTKCEKCRK
jgi:hypothetical protein